MQGMMSGRRDRERGAIAVMTALCLTIFLIMTALVVDAGRMYVERSELQTAADAAALSGATALFESEAVAEATAEMYFEKNLTQDHPGSYSVLNGDLIDARLLSNSGGCAVDGETYDCVKVKATTPEFELFFGKTFGYDSTAVTADATVVVGNAAMGGDILVPWVVRDCPDAYGEARGYPEEDSDAVRSEMTRIGMTCPYVFDDRWGLGERRLFLDTGTGGNFQGADLSKEPDCPAYPSGYFPTSGGSGASDYRDFLEGDPTDDVTACPIGPGARIHAKSGGMAGPTRQGVIARNVDTCMNQASFSAALSGEGDGDGFVEIEQMNPCIIIILMVVKADPGAANVDVDLPGDVSAMQHPDVTDPVPGDNDELWRFGVLSNGVTNPLVVRRLAFFYMTGRPSGNTNNCTTQPNCSYRGMFLRAVRTDDALLSGPADPNSGVYITKLVE